MMQREKVSDNVYVFQSELYAQVTASIVVGSEWAVAIDTLAYPEETLEIRDFVEQELKVPVRYVINTHYHADHCWGNCYFPGALIISHQLCREYLLLHGGPSIEEARKQNNVFRQSKITLPHITFAEGELSLQVDDKVLKMMSLPGHSPDGIGVLIEEDKTLISGDIFMSLPYLVDGNIDVMIKSLKKIGKMDIKNIVQGHGGVILRGEVDRMIDDHLLYLSTIRKIVNRAARRDYPGEMLDAASVEACGKERVIMGGVAEELHRRNLDALYHQLYGEYPVYPDDEW
ncbi:MAG: MBL fold metallo-hydrolase [Chloroflexota bacterium]|nr:MBL fold metallo-hydrolase [Chloroflexota bacterium]